VNNTTRNLARMALIAAGLLFASGMARADAVTDNARALLDKGDAKAAYALLEPLESQRAGNPDYDFLLGLAAIEIGKHTNAVFAFERVLAVDPNHVRARAEIARAYLALGETKTAKQEFESVQKQGVPPEAAATIDRLISAVERSRMMAAPPYAATPKPPSATTPTSTAQLPPAAFPCPRSAGRS